MKGFKEMEKRLRCNPVQPTASARYKMHAGTTLKDYSHRSMQNDPTNVA